MISSTPTWNVWATMSGCLSLCPPSGASGVYSTAQNQGAVLELVPSLC